MSAKSNVGDGSPRGAKSGTAGLGRDLSPAKPTDGPITLAALSGDQRALVVALRDHIARVIDGGCAARDLVGLSRRLIDLSAEVAHLDARESASGLRLVVDEHFDPEAI
jgi:hypothetical protein